MSKMKVLEINGQSFEVLDSGAVRFDQAQTLTEKQKSQARVNIGSVPLTVTIDEEGMASHTSAEIYAHVQSGGSVRLLYGESYYTPVRVEEPTAWFCYNSDDGFAYSISIVGENPIDEYEYHIPNANEIEMMIDEKLGVIENGSY